MLFAPMLLYSASGRCRGLVLDIGCGTNELVRRYRSQQGRTIGVDVHPWPGADVVCDKTRLPFPARHFDTTETIPCVFGLNCLYIAAKDAT